MQRRNLALHKDCFFRLNIKLFSSLSGLSNGLRIILATFTANGHGTIGRAVMSLSEYQDFY